MQLGKINLNLLSALYYLLQEQSVTRAAEKMHLSQSAMSKHLAKLREVFGDPLLVRVQGQLQATPKGLELKAQVAPLLDSVENLLHQQVFEPSLCQRTFTIATSDYVSEHLPPKVLGLIYEQAPQLNIELCNWDHTTNRLLHSGEVDLGMTLPPKDSTELHATTLGTDRLVCLMHQQHPYLALNTPSVADYCRYPHAIITTGADKNSHIDRYLQQQGFQRQIQFRASSYPATVQILSETRFILTLPAKIAQQLVKQRPLAIVDLPFTVENFEYSLIWHHRNHHDPAHSWFRQQIHQAMT
ncbi:MULTISPECIES: LysR family transcriptional regulator [unclassified Agarivorans]|uniref:LysR family transcriptional regulator n=1 Tax=unclassified Agarivorans TaxID=2636026 RepID=UPI0026E2C3D1|nr:MULTISPECIES: LysR family transcriptional regulator [unclassified Agarivorans]MDO6686785.1 LysR family transcriptional regulator [Agarivorans sp. 3_MG-2023]MDO6716485.1 LysR family transcriptional regulator [Agarivorans sp. 2_MG-2023]